MRDEISDLDREKIERLAKELGDSAASRLNVDSVADAVVERLREEDVPNPRTTRWRSIRVVAAAAVLVLAIGLLRLPGLNVETDDSLLFGAPQTLEVLSEDELVEVIDSLQFEAPVSEIAAAGLEDLSEGQLEELLQTMMED